MALAHNRHNSHYQDIYDKYKAIINYHDTNEQEPITSFCSALQIWGTRNEKYEKLCKMLMAFGAHTVDDHMYKYILNQAYSKGKWYKDSPAFTKSILGQMIKRPTNLLDGCTLLSHLVQQNKAGDISTVITLMKISDVPVVDFLNAKNHHNDIALHIACMMGKTNLVQQIIVHYQDALQNKKCCTKGRRFSFFNPTVYGPERPIYLTVRRVVWGL